jgi:hypothetical protein
MGHSPDPPAEDPVVKRLRARQIRELAELDEEENERLKRAFTISRGTRAFSRVPTRGNNPSANAQGGRISRPVTRMRRGGGNNPRSQIE